MKRAIISVWDKTGLDEFAKALVEQGYEILSTSGTATYLKRAGIGVIEISNYTGFTETQDGRVKTLHTKLYTDILGRPAGIELVVVNLYPFELKMKEGLSLSEMVEFIDIGGVTLLRGAAKNFEYVTVVSSPDQYGELLNDIKENKGPTPGIRAKFAQKAFERTASYDAAISSYLSDPHSAEIAADENQISLSAVNPVKLRYGENPHQKGIYYRFPNSTFGFKELLGPELSYNNLMDMEAAILLVEEFSNPAVAIVKHANPCGVAESAESENYARVFARAYNADALSAYGGVIALNRPLDEGIMEFLSGKFVEVLLVPDIPSAPVVELFAKKKKLRLVQYSGKMPAFTVRSTLGGLLYQDRDNAIESAADCKVVTKRSPTEEEKKAMDFAWKVCKHARSNAVVITSKDTSLGIGAGLPNRVDSARRALRLLKEQSREGVKVCASDGLFPFADSIESLKGSAVSAVIQPGGSLRDEEVIAEADAQNIAMVFTGVRHFSHW